MRTAQNAKYAGSCAGDNGHHMSVNSYRTPRRRPDEWLRLGSRDGFEAGDRLRRSWRGNR